MAVLSYDHNQSLGFLTGMASRLLNNLLVTRFREADVDMTAEQWGAILLVLNDDAMTQGQLGERLCLEKSSVSRLVDGLERRGWIARTTDREDARKRLLAPTPKALEAAESCATIARAVVTEAQQGMTADEKRACQSLLSRIIKNLSEQTG